MYSNKLYIEPIQAEISPLILFLKCGSYLIKNVAIPYLSWPKMQLETRIEKTGCDQTRSVLRFLNADFKCALTTETFEEPAKKINLDPVRGVHANEALSKLHIKSCYIFITCSRENQSSQFLSPICRRARAPSFIKLLSNWARV